MAHHRHTVKRRLTIEKDGVTVQHVAVHHITLKQLKGLELRRRNVLQSDGPTIDALNGLRTRILIGTGLNQCVHTVDIEGRHPFGEGKVHSDLEGNAELLNGDVRIRRNDGTGGKFHAFALEIVADAPLLCTETLFERLERATRTLCGLTDPRQIVIDQRGNMELKKKGPFVNGALLRTL
jgi:hypothetical protein